MKRLYKILLILLFPGCITAQDVQFSQYYSAGLYLAPSFAGGTRGGRAAISYRNQWPEIPNQFNTYYVGVDHFFPKYQSGAGIYMMRDYIGSGKLVTTSMQLQYSYNVKINRWLYLRPGAQVGYLHRGIDRGRLLFGDQLDFEGNTPVTSVPLPYTNVGLFDYAASVLFYADFLWLGASFDHLPFPNESLLGAESSSPLKFSIFGGVRYALKKRLILQEQDYISLSYIYKQQDIFKQFDLGFYWERYPMQVGIWYRGLPVVKTQYEFMNHDALVMKIGVLFEQFSAGYSYDFTISRLRSFSGGAHEISLIVLFNQNQSQKKRYRALPCPNF